MIPKVERMAKAAANGSTWPAVLRYSQSHEIRGQWRLLLLRLGTGIETGQYHGSGDEVKACDRYQAHSTREW